MLPYTYLIGWTEYNKYYYGVRYSKECHPSDLWVRYKTSSNYVKMFVDQFGPPDIIAVRRTFTTKEAAMQWEEKVLIRMKVKTDDRFLNRWDNNMVPINLSGPFPFQFKSIQDKVTNSFLEKYGARGNAVDSIMKKTMQTNLERYGLHHTTHLEQVKKAREQANLAKFGVTNPFFSKAFQDAQLQPMDDPVIRAKHKTIMENMDWSERNIKTKQTNMERYGTECLLNSPENQSRRKRKSLEKYGVPYYSQSTEFKDHIKSLKVSCPFGCKNGHLFDPGNFSKHMIEAHNWSKLDVKTHKNQKNKNS